MSLIRERRPFGLTPLGHDYIRKEPSPLNATQRIESLTKTVIERVRKHLAKKRLSTLTTHDVTGYILEAVCDFPLGKDPDGIESVWQNIRNEFKDIFDLPEKRPTGSVSTSVVFKKPKKSRMESDAMNTDLAPEEPTEKMQIEVPNSELSEKVPSESFEPLAKNGAEKAVEDDADKWLKENDPEMQDGKETPEDDGQSEEVHGSDTTIVNSDHRDESDDILDSDDDLGDEDFVEDYNAMFEEEDFRALGLDPTQPTTAKPGTEDKVMILAARYASGLPLWHPDDCKDQGPAKFTNPDEEFDDDEENNAP